MGHNEKKAIPNVAQKKLLELAAKAAAIQLRWSAEDGFSQYGTVTTWNPLDDFGDAMDLATKLLMSFQVDHVKGVQVYLGEYRSEDLDADVYAAFRRAIVSVAAQIGQDCS